MPFLPVGGQAVIEGVMMRAPSKIAVAVRRADGSVDVHGPAVRVRHAPRHRLLGLPVVRGAVSLFETMFARHHRAQLQRRRGAREDEPAETARRASRARRRPRPRGAGRHRPGLARARRAAVRGAAGAAHAAGSGFHDRVGVRPGRRRCSGCWRSCSTCCSSRSGRRWRACSATTAPSTRRSTRSRPASPLTPENVQKFSRLHPRCGTTFLFLVVIVSIVVFTFIGRPTNLGQHLLRIACMPLIAGVAFEFIRLSGKYFDRPCVRALTWPGMQFQRLTTREPDLEMCAVAIASLERVLDDPTVVKLRAEARHEGGELRPMIDPTMQRGAAARRGALRRARAAALGPGRRVATRASCATCPGSARGSRRP